MKEYVLQVNDLLNCQLEDIHGNWLKFYNELPLEKAVLMQHEI